jgi:hypothetical protein
MNGLAAQYTILDFGQTPFWCGVSLNGVYVSTISDKNRHLTQRINGQIRLPFDFEAETW